MKDEVERTQLKVRSHFKVFDVPLELINKYIAYAKLHCDNQVWRVMELGMKSLQAKTFNLDDLKVDLFERIENLEIELRAEIEKVKKLNLVEEKEKVKTFGGGEVE